MPSVCLIFGTRPEAIKMAPVHRVLAGVPGLDCRVCLTAQHREMLDRILDVFGIVADEDLDIMRADQDLFDVTARVLAGLRGYLQERRPDLILVHGDTTTTLAAALAGFYLRIPVGHVEAGLRTGRRYSPFPEEMNRKLTTSLASLHFAPTPRNRENLLAEGVADDAVTVTGNTAIDALQLVLAADDEDDGAPRFSPGRRGVLVTAHRRENFGAGIEGICRAIRTLAAERPDLEFVYPVHPNPNIKGPVGRLLGNVPGVRLIEPVDYTAFVRLMHDAVLILSDSGGVQEEAPSLGRPVLVLRECTERPEAVAAGTVRVVGSDPENIADQARRLLDDPEAYQRMARAVNPYGDGHAAARIGAVICRHFGLAPGDLAACGDFPPAP